MNIENHPLNQIIQETPVLNTLYNMFACHGANQLSMFSDVLKALHNIIQVIPEPLREEGIQKLIEVLESMKQQQPKPPAS